MGSLKLHCSILLLRSYSNHRIISYLNLLAVTLQNIFSFKSFYCKNNIIAILYRYCKMIWNLNAKEKWKQMNIPFTKHTENDPAHPWDTQIPSVDFPYVEPCIHALEVTLGRTWTTVFALGTVQTVFFPFADEHLTVAFCSWQVGLSS